MSPQRWTEIQDLFAVAVQQSADKRSAFLDECCGSDDDLRGELESLLAASSQAGAFLEEPAIQIAGRGTTLPEPTLQPGCLIGPYKLATPLGRGGMGEVWRAHDTRVARDVAIKFCDTRFSARFEREARAIAALNHPNICQLYDVGPNYLVMELVEGQQPHGPISIANALACARQVADALEAAHERGIVHRDLKPANIHIRPDGTVKVLDFGVARLAETEQDDNSVENTPHSGSLISTDGGSLVGTPTWMSPEQTRGQKVDRRTDIWAFGVLLFYSLTGSNPFERSTLAETQDAVLTYEPNFDALPIEIRRLVRKCLEKDVKRRLRDIGDAWELLDTPGNLARSSARRNRLPGLAAAAFVSAAMAALFWLLPLRRNESDRSLMRLDLDLGAEVSLSTSGTADFVLSPDGRSLAFVSRGKLFLHDLEQAAAKQVGSVQGVHSPFFSPDGRWIGFFAQGKLRKISVQGGAAVDICSTSAYFSGAAWGPDDFITASLTPSGPLQQVPASGGSPVPITTLDTARGETTHRLPQYLPGGRAILFTTHDAITGFDDAAIEVMTLSDGKRKHLIKGGTFGRYVQSGHVLYISRGVLYAVPFDVARLEVRGTPVALLRDIAYSLYGSAQLDVSSSGMLVYRTGGPDLSGVTLQKIGAGRDHQPLLATPGTYLNPRVSPDGRRILLATRETDELALSVYDSRRGVLNTLVQYPAGSPSVVWAPFAIFTPDGKFVIFRGERGMFWVRSDSVGQPYRLTTSSMSQTPSAISPDGRTLLYYEGAGLVGTSDIWAVSIQYGGSGMTANEARPVVKTKADENQAAFSADGRWFAYVAADAASPQVFVRSWPDDGRTWQISSEGGSQPRFGSSGTELFYLNQDQQLMSVLYSVIRRDFVPERPRLWSDKQVASLGATFWSYDLIPNQDGVVALAMAERSHRLTQNRLVVLLNAFEHLHRLAPVR